MGERRNRVGNAYALTVFTPILVGHEEQVRETVESLPRGPASPLARVDQLHLSRLHILDRFVDQGPPHKPEQLKSSYLIFTSTIDGALDPYLDAICERLPEEADSWWGHCVGYPGAGNRDAFRRYIRHNQLHTSLFASAYPRGSVAEVRRCLALRERVLAFAIGAQDLEAPELQAQFQQTFEDVL